MKKYAFILLILISINGFSQFSYGPRIGVGMGLPSIKTESSASGELDLDSKVSINALAGFFLSKQFDSNFMIDFGALFHAPTKLRFTTPNGVQEVRYKGWHLNLNFGSKINYNVRGFVGAGLSYPLTNESDLQALADAMSNFGYGYGGEPFLNLGMDYFTNKFTVAAVLKVPLNFWGPFIDVGDHKVNLSILELRFSPNLNK